MGKAWVDRWLRIRKVEKRAKALTLTVQQKSCCQSESIYLEAGWCYSISGHGAVWETASVYLTRIGCAALVSSAQANMAQLVLYAKEIICLNQGRTLTPTALKAGQELAVVWPPAFEGHGDVQRLQPAPGFWVRWEHRDVSESFPCGPPTDK